MKHQLSAISILPVIFAVVSVSAFAQQDADEEKRSDDKKNPFENRRILSIDFRGNKIFTSDTLLELMKYQKVGDAYSAEAFQANLDLLRIFSYADDGYLQVHFQNPEIKDTPDGIRITIPVTEGRRYRIGEIKIENAKFISSDEALQILDIKKGEIAIYSDMRRKPVRLCNGYPEQGHPQCSVRLIPNFHDGSDETSDGTVDLTVLVEEGEKYFFGKIEFTGNTKIDSAVLLANLLFHEGEVFKSTLINNSVQRLFDLGLFTDVAAEAHYHNQSKMNVADITIHLKEKQ